MRRSEDRIGLKSGWFRTVIPYSVSMPITFGSAMGPSRERCRPWMRAAGRGRPAPSTPERSEVLAGVDALDRALLFLRLAHQRLHVDDALALFAGDFGPVVGVGGIGEVLVFLEL